MSFAKGTRVSVEKSRAELDTLLKKHGASSRLVGVDDEHHRAVVGFAMKGARFRLNIPLPGDRHPLPRARLMTPREREQAARERWRLVILLLKAKLEAIQLGLSTPTREFMADLIVNPDGNTLEEVLNGGGMSRLLLGPASKEYKP